MSLERTELSCAEIKNLWEKVQTTTSS